MNEELFEKTAASRLTRRTIVKTGTKLAYAAPVVAASMKLGTRSAWAQDEVVSPGGVGNPGFCGHSVGADGNPADGNEGCKGACKSTCGGAAGDFDTLDAQDPCEQICDSLCPIGTTDRQCGSTAACDPDNFTCSECSATFTDPGSGQTTTGTKTTGNCAP
jgi:hypothetical protein